MGTKAGCTGWLPNIPTGAGVVSNANGKGCMELGREPGGPGREGWIIGAPDMLGPDMVGIDMEGRDMGGPDTGGPGIRGMDDIVMGCRGIGAWLDRTEAADMSGLDMVLSGMVTVDTGAADMAAWTDICWLDREGGPGMVGIVGPGGGVC